MQEEFQELKKLIDQYDVVSFDVFDTLLLRNVLKPTDLFWAMESYVLEEYQIAGFAEKRILAEAKSRVGHENNETTLGDIYTTFANEYPCDKEKLFEKELQVETKFLVKNPWMYEIYAYAKKKHKKVLAISDMYLPKDFIVQVLKDQGYDLDGVYVSSTNFQVKGNQSLFHFVQKEEDIDLTKWIHIGDNRISDYESPKSMGIEAYHYISVGQRSGFQNQSDTLAESIFKAVSQNKIFTSLRDLDEWEVFGIRYVAPLYYSFTNWIYQLTKHKDNIYFLARDGYAVKQVYEMFMKKLNKNIDTYYLYCSRASFQVPTLCDKEKAFALDVLTRFNPTMNQKVKIESILKSLELDPANYKKEFQNFELNKDVVLNNENLYRVKKFLSYIYGDILEKLQQKKSVVQMYLKEMHLEQYDTINIVDIGWAGSTQFALYDLLDKSITGYYFGTRKSMYDDVKYNSFGYMFDAEEPKDRYKKIDENVMMYEFIFSAPHGSTLGFKKEKDKIVPILGDNSVNNEFIEKFQAAAIQLCQQYLKYYDELKYASPDISLDNYHEFIEQKNYADLQMFSKVKESVGYDGAKIPFVPSFKVEEIKQDLTEFYHLVSTALWKNSFLIEGKNEKEYSILKKNLFSKKTRVRCLLKNIHFKSIFRAIRYPRTTLRKIKVILKND